MNRNIQFKFINWEETLFLVNNCEIANWPFYDDKITNVAKFNLQTLKIVTYLYLHSFSKPKIDKFTLSLYFLVSLIIYQFIIHKLLMFKRLKIAQVKILRICVEFFLMDATWTQNRRIEVSTFNYQYFVLYLECRLFS